MENYTGSALSWNFPRIDNVQIVSYNTPRLNKVTVPPDTSGQYRVVAMHRCIVQLGLIVSLCAESFSLSIYQDTQTTYTVIPRLTSDPANEFFG